MKQYIRTTHNFNNETREWEYRGNPGMDMYEHWKRIDKHAPRFKYTLGVHGLERDQWVILDRILMVTIEALREGAVDHVIEKEFNDFAASNPNYLYQIRENILNELDYLVQTGQVMVKDK